MSRMLRGTWVLREPNPLGSPRNLMILPSLLPLLLLLVILVKAVAPPPLRLLPIPVPLMPTTLLLLVLFCTTEKSRKLA